MNTRFTKLIDNKTVIKERKNIVLHVTKQIENPITQEMEEQSFQIFNPSDELLLEDGWVLYVKPEPTEEEQFMSAKNEKKNEIEFYDSSSEVNVFYIQEIPIWLDKATRAGLKLRFEAELAMGMTETTLWYNNMQFPLSLENGMMMLYAIEVYASKCYDNTQMHLANVEKIETMEELNNYDYTTGYPEKLNF